MAGEVQLQIRNGPQGRGPACREGQERRQQGREGMDRREVSSGAPWAHWAAEKSWLISFPSSGKNGGNPFSFPPVGAGEEPVWLGREVSVPEDAVLKLFLFPQGALPESCGLSMVPGLWGHQPFSNQEGGQEKWHRAHHRVLRNGPCPGSGYSVKGQATPCFRQGVAFELCIEGAEGRA